MPPKPDPPLRLGSYKPPGITDSTGEDRPAYLDQHEFDVARKSLGDYPSLVWLLNTLYPTKGGGLEPEDKQLHPLIGRVIKNNQPVADRQTLTMAAQALGDRPVTTMTNPLPNYTPPAMVNTPLAAQLRAMINHALAQRGLSPLINTPLPVGPTQMGMAR